MKAPRLKVLASLLVWLLCGPTQSQAQPPGAGAWDAADWSAAQAGRPLDERALVRVGPPDSALCDVGANPNTPGQGNHTWFPEQNGGFSKIPGGVPFRRSNVGCSNGELTLRLAGGPGAGFTGGAVDGLSRDGRGFSFKYGYYEVSLLAPPPPPGVCPWLGVWFLQQFTHDWSADGYLELDQLETCLQSPIGPERQVSTLHLWPARMNPGRGFATKHRQKQLARDAVVFDGRYHQYGALWTPDAFILYVDRREVGRFPTLGSDTDHPMYPMLDVSLYRPPTPAAGAVDYSVRVRWSRFYALAGSDGGEPRPPSHRRHHRRPWCWPG